MSHRARLGMLMLVLSSQALAFSPNAAPTDSLEQRVAPCLACHSHRDADLGSGYVPHLDGKPAGYLYNQLLNYRDHRRNNPVMVNMVRNLSDSYLWEIAAYFSARTMSFRERQPREVDGKLLERGKTLVTEGDRQEKIPACQSCHGERLTGVQPNTPGLVGLPRDYLSAQLGAWREGTRHAATPDCMRKIAEELTPRDINAVATWLASHPVPDNPQAATVPPTDPPMDCGSVALPGGLR